MKKLILILCASLVFNACKHEVKKPTVNLRDGFYEVVQTESVNAETQTGVGRMVVSFDTLFNPGDYTMVVIDTTDFVPLELETSPEVIPVDDHKKLLSVSLSPSAAEKVKTFTASRVMKHVAIMLDGKALTQHMIREAITGNQVQISRCNDNACEYLYTKMKDRVMK